MSLAADSLHFSDTSRALALLQEALVELRIVSHAERIELTLRDVPFDTETIGDLKLRIASIAPSAGGSRVPPHAMQLRMNGKPIDVVICQRGQLCAAATAAEEQLPQPSILSMPRADRAASLAAAVADQSEIEARTQEAMTTFASMPTDKLPLWPLLSQAHRQAPIHDTIETSPSRRRGREERQGLASKSMAAGRGNSSISPLMLSGIGSLSTSEAQPARRHTHRLTLHLYPSGPLSATNSLLTAQNASHDTAKVSLLKGPANFFQNVPLDPKNPSSPPRIRDLGASDGQSSPVPRVGIDDDAFLRRPVGVASPSSSHGLVMSPTGLRNASTTGADEDAGSAADRSSESLVNTSDAWGSYDRHAKVKDRPMHELAAEARAIMMRMEKESEASLERRMSSPSMLAVAAPPAAAQSHQQSTHHQHQHHSPPAAASTGELLTRAKSPTSALMLMSGSTTSFTATGIKSPRSPALPGSAAPLLVAGSSPQQQQQSTRFSPSPPKTGATRSSPLRRKRVNEIEAQLLEEQQHHQQQQQAVAASSATSSTALTPRRTPAGATPVELGTSSTRRSRTPTSPRGVFTSSRSGSTALRTSTSPAPSSSAIEPTNEVPRAEFSSSLKRKRETPVQRAAANVESASAFASVAESSAGTFLSVHGSFSRSAAVVSPPPPAAASSATPVDAAAPVSAAAPPSTTAVAAARSPDGISILAVEEMGSSASRSPSTGLALTPKHGGGVPPVLAVAAARQQQQEAAQLILDPPVSPVPAAPQHQPVTDPADGAQPLTSPLVPELRAHEPPPTPQSALQTPPPAAAPRVTERSAVSESASRTHRQTSVAASTRTVKMAKIILGSESDDDDDEVVAPCNTATEHAGLPQVLSTADETPPKPMGGPSSQDASTSTAAPMPAPAQQDLITPESSICDASMITPVTDTENHGQVGGLGINESGSPMAVADEFEDEYNDGDNGDGDGDGDGSFFTEDEESTSYHHDVSLHQQGAVRVSTGHGTPYQQHQQRYSTRAPSAEVDEHEAMRRREAADRAHLVSSPRTGHRATHAEHRRTAAAAKEPVLMYSTVTLSDDSPYRRRASSGTYEEPPQNDYFSSRVPQRRTSSAAAWGNSARYPHHTAHQQQFQPAASAAGFSPTHVAVAPMDATASEAQTFSRPAAGRPAAPANNNDDDDDDDDALLRVRRRVAQPSSSSTSARPTLMSMPYPLASGGGSIYATTATQRPSPFGTPPKQQGAASFAGAKAYLMSPTPTQ